MSDRERLGQVARDAITDPDRLPWDDLDGISRDYWMRVAEAVRQAVLADHAHSIEALETERVFLRAALTNLVQSIRTEPPDRVELFRQQAIRVLTGVTPG